MLRGVYQVDNLLSVQDIDLLRKQYETELNVIKFGMMLVILHLPFQAVAGYYRRFITIGKFQILTIELYSSSLKCC